METSEEFVLFRTTISQFTLENTESCGKYSPKMSLRVAAKRSLRPFPQVGQSAEPTAELKFISELGRSLLFMVHPRKVALRVASAIKDGVSSNSCVFVAGLDNIGVVSCGFDEKGELDKDFLDRQRFDKWLEVLPPQIGYSETDPDKFLLRTNDHRLEYVSPLHINGETKGAIIVGFARRSDFTEAKGA